MESLKQAVLRIKNENNYSLAMNGVLSLIIEDKMTPIALKKYFAQQAITFDDIKKESLSLVINYARICLEDDILTEEEMHNISMLKRFLHICEGDFYKYNYNDSVKELLSCQLHKMYKDNIIDKDEALMKTDLQQLFGLSYDEFLVIVNDVALDALDRGANILDLDTFM